MKKLWIRDVKCLAKVTQLVSYGARTRTRVCPMPSILATQHLPLRVPGRDVTWSGSKGVALFLRFSWLQGTLTPKVAQNNHSSFLLKIVIKSQALFHWGFNTEAGKSPCPLEISILELERWVNGEEHLLLLQRTSLVPSTHI